VESDFFRAMLIALNPNLGDGDIPHRTAIHNRLVTRYRQDRAELQAKLKVCHCHYDVALIADSTTLGFNGSYLIDLRHME
jgi:hypothetical protein